MTTQHGGCPVVAFDHNSAQHSADHVEVYRRLRAEAPVAWTEAHGGYWVLSDYAGVFEAARDDATFASGRSKHGGTGLSNVIPKAPVRLHIPVELDLPEHRSYRKVINPLTSPGAVARMRPLVERWTTAFVDDVIEDGTCDLASVIGVPAVVTVDWLGLDVDDWPRYSRALHSVLAHRTGSPEHAHAVQVDIPWMERTISEAIAWRRQTPRDDVITTLLEAEVDGAPITDDAVYSIVELLISGGVGTTASLVSQTLVHLYRHPDQRARLVEEPELLDRAVEEFLRVFSPTQALARTVAHDVDVRGGPMREGDRVLLAWASANRDPAQFDHPDEVDLDRWPNRHTAFGMGIHRCAGAHIGRAIARELIQQVITRMPDYVVDEGGLEAYPHQGVNAASSGSPRCSPRVGGWGRERRPGSLGTANRPRDRAGPRPPTPSRPHRHRHRASRTRRARGPRRRGIPASAVGADLGAPSTRLARRRAGGARASSPADRTADIVTSCAALGPRRRSRPRRRRPGRPAVADPGSPDRLRRGRGRVASFPRGPLPRGRARRIRGATLDVGGHRARP